MAQLVLQPDAAAGLDNYLNKESVNTNHGTLSSMKCGAAWDGKAEQMLPWRPILEYDISSIPAGSTIAASSKLELYVVTTHTTSDACGIARLDRMDWEELQSTWNIYKTGSNWTSAGGDYGTLYGFTGPTSSAPPAATLAISGAGQLQRLLQEALDDDAGQVVLFMKVVDETGSADKGFIFTSSDGSTAAERPKLTVDYTPPAAVGPVVGPTLMGQSLGVF